MTFPEKYIRGIFNKGDLKEDGSIGAHIFYFISRPLRDDGYQELSINWNDDDEAIDFTLNQKKENGELQFKAGIAILPREHIDYMNTLSTINELLSYERRSMEKNPYHGNLLLSDDVSKPRMKLIAATIALSATHIPHE